MEKFESLVLKISRGFGLLLMVGVLVTVTALLALQFGTAAKSLFEKSYPEVKFVKADFVKSAEPEANAASSPRREDEIASEVAAAFMPVFENDLGEYLTKNETTLFPDAVTRAEKKAAYAAEKKKAFADAAQKYVKSWLLDFPEKYWPDFAKKSIKYVLAAAEAQIRPFLVENQIVETPKQSLVFMNFARKYNAEFKELKKYDSRDNGNTMEKAISYAGLFFLVFVALLGGMMLAVMRIEAKFKKE